MSNKTPQNDAFTKSKTYANIELILDISAFVISLIQIRSGVFGNQFYIGLALLFVLANYFVAKNKDQQFEKATAKRLSWLIDNSFEIKRIQGFDSSDYFDTSDIDVGFKKLFANTHENALFTSEISKKSYKQYSATSIFLSIMTVAIFLCSGTNEFTSLLLNAVLTGKLFERTRTIKKISSQTEKIFDSFNEICGEYDKSKNYEMLMIYGIELVIRYESLISENKFVQSERIFRKKNHELTERWNNIKTEYSIYK